MIRKLTVMLLSGAIFVLGVTSAWAVKYNEAPMLKVKVAAGELPPVEQRLPDEPQVIKPVEEIGQYGGTVYVATQNPTSPEDAQYGLCGPEPLLRVTPCGKSVVPNIAKSWEFSEEKKVLTLHLRKGIKWSDGAPFTVDDIMFWWEDVTLNKELTPRISSAWCPGGEPMKVEKIDEYTVRLRFAIPYYHSLAYLAYWTGVIYQPKHYLKKFHPRYTAKEKLENLVKKEGFEFWYQLFLAKNPVNLIVGPRLTAFYVKEKKAGETLLERNPYYWKVDPEGNQLPYIDKIALSLVESPEVVNMRIISGEIDFAGLHTTLANWRLYKENAEKGNYRVLPWTSNINTEVGLFVNQTHKDPILRKIMQDNRFRYALSLAINREEINEAIFYGMGEPRQSTVHSWSALYEERFAKAYAEYNSKEANKLLNEMGLDKRDSEGYRLRPDKKRLTLTIEYWPGQGSRTEICELVKEYWEVIGIKTTLKPEERSFYNTRVNSNEFNVGLWHIVTKTDYLCYNQFQYVGQANPEAGCWPAWLEWNLSKGKTGEEPPAKIKELFKIYKNLEFATSEEETLRLAKKIIKFQAENINIIGTVGDVIKPIIAKNNLRNIPEKGMWAWDSWFMGTYCPEQFFLKK